MKSKLKIFKGTSEAIIGEDLRCRKTSQKTFADTIGV